MTASRLTAVSIACLGALLLVGPATTGAFLFDIDASTANPLTVGTLDTKLSEVGAATEDSTTDDQSVDTATDTWEDQELSAGALVINDVVNNTLRINNSKSDYAVETVNVTVSYVENDSDGTSGNPDNTSSTLVVTSLEYQNTELVGSEVVDENGNGEVDVQDLTMGDTAANLSTLDGMTAGGSADLTLVIEGNRALLDLSTGDGVDFTLKVRSTGAGFTDRDQSLNNTIIYG